MKRLILTILAAGALTTASAQFLSFEALNGALLGTMIGGIAGGDCHHGFSGNGAAIGAGVGLLAGAVVGEVNRRSYYASQPGYYYYPAPVSVSPGYGYGPAFVSAPVYVAPPPPRPSYVAPRPQVWRAAANPGWARQIPDAPRVPDAPTF